MNEFGKADCRHFTTDSILRLLPSDYAVRVVPFPNIVHINGSRLAPHRSMSEFNVGVLCVISCKIRDII